MNIYFRTDLENKLCFSTKNIIIMINDNNNNNNNNNNCNKVLETKDAEQL